MIGAEFLIRSGSKGNVLWLSTLHPAKPDTTVLTMYKFHPGHFESGKTEAGVEALLGQCLDLEAFERAAHYGQFISAPVLRQERPLDARFPDGLAPEQHMARILKTAPEPKSAATLLAEGLEVRSPLIYVSSRILYAVQTVDESVWLMHFHNVGKTTPDHAAPLSEYANVPPVLVRGVRSISLASMAERAYRQLAMLEIPDLNLYAPLVAVEPGELVTSAGMNTFIDTCLWRYRVKGDVNVPPWLTHQERRFLDLEPWLTNPWTSEYKYHGYRVERT